MTGTGTSSSFICTGKNLVTPRRNPPRRHVGSSARDVRRLRLLVELSRRGTIAAVAQALAYSPSAVSQQLGVLEKEAGGVLLEPVGRRVRLNAAGQVLVAHAEIVIR